MLLRARHRGSRGITPYSLTVCIFAAFLMLSACGGGSSTGGGTADSPFVGRYTGSTNVTVSAAAATRTVDETVSIYVNQDGLVQFGDGGTTIYASGPLEENSVSIEGDAAALVNADCSGVITLAGAFSFDDEGNAIFRGGWSSSDAACFGVSGKVSGPLTAQRVSPNARASRVFETSSPALEQAFRRAAN